MTYPCHSDRTAESCKLHELVDTEGVLRKQLLVYPLSLILTETHRDIRLKQQRTSLGMFYGILEGDTSAIPSQKHSQHFCFHVFLCGIDNLIIKIQYTQFS